MYPFEAILNGFDGIANERVVVGITDHALIGLLVSLIDPSIRIVPGFGQNPVPPVLVRQHVAVVVQSLCFPLLFTVSLIIRVS